MSPEENKAIVRRHLEPVEFRPTRPVGSHESRHDSVNASRDDRLLEHRQPRRGYADGRQAVNNRRSNLRGIRIR